MGKKLKTLLVVVLGLVLNLASGCATDQSPAQSESHQGTNWVDDVGFTELSREEQAHRLNIDLMSDSPKTIFTAVSTSTKGDVYAVGFNDDSGIVVRYSSDLTRLRVSKERLGYFHDVAVAADGSVYALGYSKTDLVIIRYTAELEEVARVRCGNVQNSRLAVSTNGRVYIAGYHNLSSSSYAIVKYYYADLTEGRQHIRYDVNGSDRYMDIGVAADGTVYVAGGIFHWHYTDTEAPIVIRFDSSLTSVQYQYRGEWGDGHFSHIAVAADGTVFTANANPFPGVISISKFNTELEEVTSVVMQDAQADADLGNIPDGTRKVYGLATGLDGSLYVTGNVQKGEGEASWTDAAVIKLDGDLQELNIVSWGYGLKAVFGDICVAADGTVYAVGEALIAEDGGVVRIHAIIIR